jgi:alpha-D-glucose phosphate-specific phosphoglucomutase
VRKIKFGTSGWRAILADDFTVANLRAVLQAICDHLKEEKVEDKGVVIGRDCRFLGERFVDEAVRVFAGNGIKASVCADPAPTPAISFAIIERGAGGGINFTASHNPPEYNGIKFSPAWGGPALPETTFRIEELANANVASGKFKTMSLEQASEKGLYEVFDPRIDYLERVAELVDLEAVGMMEGNIIVDLLWGTARGYLDELLEVHCGKEIIKLNDENDPYFGGSSPEPSEENLAEMIEMLEKDDDNVLGLSCDGDADRFGVVDSGGKFIEPNYIIALLADYLIEEKGYEGALARTVATSHLIDKVAKKHGRELIETPVGFKYLGDMIAQDKIVIGGEESAGLSIRGHVPEKDGIVAVLLVAEMMAKRGKSLGQQLKELYDEVGPVHTARINLRLTEEKKKELAGKLAAAPASFAGKKVIDTIKIDGTKFILENDCWLLMRESGTEPVVRLYCEAPDEKTLAGLIEAGRAFIES